MRRIPFGFGFAMRRALVAASLFLAGGAALAQNEIPIPSYSVGLSLSSSPILCRAGSTPTATVAPWLLDVDALPYSGLSNANLILEPGETVIVRPTWRNFINSPVWLTGTASDFSGPPNATYTIVDSTVDYGPIEAMSAGSCDLTHDCFVLALTPTGPRPAQHWDATFQETPNTTDPAAVWKIHIGESFGDVPTSNPFYLFVEAIFHNAVTAGCGGTNYCPGSNATRAQMAVFLLRSKDGPAYAPPVCSAPVFSDVPCSNGFAPWINELSKRGVTAGCGGGAYCPNAPVTRAQMSVFLLRTKEGPSFSPPACTTPLFADVPCSSGFAPWINELAARGITAGCGGGNYCPGNAVTRGQMAVFLTVTFGLSLYGL
jgi:S-layer family protein